jgi:hypothetical protein
VKKEMAVRDVLRVSKPNPALALVSGVFPAQRLGVRQFSTLNG